jgi:RNA polymerase sigma-70 factor (ECF subfamily)
MMLTSQTDEAHLLAQALDLDSQALGEIHDRYYPEIYRYAAIRTGDSALADDIASEVFLRLLNALHGGRPPHTTLRGWLFGVASHLVANNFHAGQALPLSEYQSDGHSTSVEVEERILQADVRAAIQRLTAEQQEVLALRFGGGFSVEETAGFMNRSVTAVKALQFRAVDTLRRVMAEVGNG